MQLFWIHAADDMINVKLTESGLIPDDLHTRHITRVLNLEIKATLFISDEHIHFVSSKWLSNGYCLNVV